MIKLKEALRVCSYPLWLVSLIPEEETGTDMRGGKSMWRHGEKTDTYKPRRDTSEETNPASTLILNCEKINSCCLSPSVCGLCYSTLSKRMEYPSSSGAKGKTFCQVSIAHPIVYGPSCPRLPSADVSHLTNEDTDAETQRGWSRIPFRRYLPPNSTSSFARHLRIPKTKVEYKIWKQVLICFR